LSRQVDVAFVLRVARALVSQEVRGLVVDHEVGMPAMLTMRAGQVALQRLHVASSLEAEQSFRQMGEGPYAPDVTAMCCDDYFAREPGGVKRDALALHVMGRGMARLHFLIPYELGLREVHFPEQVVLASAMPEALSLAALAEALLGEAGVCGLLEVRPARDVHLV